MARAVTIAERNFAPGEYPRSVDSFPAQVQALRVTITQPIPWPGVTADTVAFINVAWDDGIGIQFGLPGGQWLNKQGNPITTKVLIVDVPKGPGGVKRKPVGGTGTFRVLQTLRAALKIEAI